MAGTGNEGADGLSRLHMQDLIPDPLLQEIYKIDKLDHETNTDFP